MTNYPKDYRPPQVLLPSSDRAASLPEAGEAFDLMERASKIAEPCVDEDLFGRLDRLCRQYQELASDAGIKINERECSVPTLMKGNRGATSDSYFGVRRSDVNSPIVMVRAIIASLAQLIPFAAEDVRRGRLSPTEFELIAAIPATVLVAAKSKPQPEKQ
jgi:hypothetical protein